MTSESLSSRRRRNRLLGDLTQQEATKRMIRVDHAGEYGAVRIYEGQRAVLGNTDLGPVLAEMAAHEEHHLETFEGLIHERHVRPTALMPFWHVAGFVLGAGTALMGPKAAMACTVAVEEAIDEHYAAQIRELDADGHDPALRDTCEKFRQDELHHKDIALDHDAEQAPGYKVLNKAIKRGSKIAIWLSERV